MNWSVDRLPDLDGKLVVVTGANSGLGLETTRGLAARGAQVIMACRNLQKAEHAAGLVGGDLPGADLQVAALDLASLQSIRSFAQSFLEQHGCLDILVNNAGLMALPLTRTEDGFEMQMGVNHLGHFALTAQLMPALQARAGARVVTVSSLAARYGKIRLDDLNWQRAYGKWPAYAQSKLANLLFAYEFQRRIDAAGLDLTSVASHPGYAATELQFAGPDMEGSALMHRVMQLSNALIAQPAAQGALPSLYAAAAADVQGGDFIGPDGFRQLRGDPVKVRSSRASHDPVVAARLWSMSEELTAVNFLS